MSLKKNPDERKPADESDAIRIHRALLEDLNPAEFQQLERDLLAALREEANVIDTSLIRPSQLQGYIKELVASPGGQLTLVFESFA